MADPPHHAGRITDMAAFEAELAAALDESEAGDDGSDSAGGGYVSADSEPRDVLASSTVGEGNSHVAASVDTPIALVDTDTALSGRLQDSVTSLLTRLPYITLVPSPIPTTPYYISMALMFTNQLARQHETATAAASPALLKGMADHKVQARLRIQAELGASAALAASVLGRVPPIPLSAPPKGGYFAAALKRQETPSNNLASMLPFLPSSSPEADKLAARADIIFAYLLAHVPSSTDAAVHAAAAVAQRHPFARHPALSAGSLPFSGMARHDLQCSQTRSSRRSATEDLSSDFSAFVKRRTSATRHTPAAELCAGGASPGGSLTAADDVTEKSAFAAGEGDPLPRSAFDASKQLVSAFVSWYLLMTFRIDMPRVTHVHCASGMVAQRSSSIGASSATAAAAALRPAHTLPKHVALFVPEPAAELPLAAPPLAASRRLRLYDTSYLIPFEADCSAALWPSVPAMALRGAIRCADAGLEASPVQSWVGQLPDVGANLLPVDAARDVAAVCGNHSNGAKLAVIARLFHAMYGAAVECALEGGVFDARACGSQVPRLAATATTETFSDGGADDAQSDINFSEGGSDDSGESVASVSAASDRTIASSRWRESLRSASADFAALSRQLTRGLLVKYPFLSALPLLPLALTRRNDEAVAAPLAVFRAKSSLVLGVGVDSDIQSVCSAGNDGLSVVSSVRTAPAMSSGWSAASRAYRGPASVMSADDGASMHSAGHRSAVSAGPGFGGAGLETSSAISSVSSDSDALSIGTSASRFAAGSLYGASATSADAASTTEAAKRAQAASNAPRLPTEADLFPGEFAPAAERRCPPYVERCDAFGSVFHLLQQWHHHRRQTAGARRGLQAAVDDAAADAMLCFQHGLLGYASVFSGAASSLLVSASRWGAAGLAGPPRLERSWSVRLGSRPAVFSAASGSAAAERHKHGNARPAGDRDDIKSFDATRLVLQVASDALFRSEDCHAPLLALCRLAGEEACRLAFRTSGAASPLAWLRDAAADLPPLCDSLLRVTAGLLADLPPCAFGFGERYCGCSSRSFQRLCAAAEACACPLLALEATGGAGAAAAVCASCAHRRIAARQAATAIYTPVILHLQAVPLLRTPAEKTAALKEVMHCITVCAGVEAAVLAEQERAAGEGGRIVDPALSADDLLPRLCFVVAAAGASLPSLASELAFAEEFLPPHLAAGSDGYCLVTLRSAMTHCIGLARAALAAAVPATASATDAAAARFAAGSGGH